MDSGTADADTPHSIGAFCGRFACSLVLATRRLSAAQQTLENKSGVRYPTMKLLDMYFWQIGATLPKNKKAVAAGE